MISRQPSNPTSSRTLTNAGLFVLSGCFQPLLVALLKEAGLANPKCQFYMLFYYLMPAIFLAPLLQREGEQKWPHRYTIYKACGAAVWDIMSQSLNYAGASMSGPTIFAIIYSSVTIWTAIFSQIFLGRIMNLWQWVNVLVVFAGLTVTATDSVNMGPNVVEGSILIIVGSAMHGLTYIICEAVMTVGDEKLTVIQNNFLQGSVAGLLFLVWQLVFTLPRSDELIWRPMENAGTSFGYAVILLGGFGMSNVVHSITYFHTLLHFPGGATSAGVMKGLQAVFVFVFTSFLYCNKLGGSEMCFSQSKFVSLVTVTGGVVGYGYATKKAVPDSGESNDKKESEHVHETSMLLPPSP